MRAQPGMWKRPVARVLMHLVRFPAGDLESVIEEVIEGTELAQSQLAALG